MPQIKSSSYMFYKKWIYKPITADRQNMIKHHNNVKSDGYDIAYIKTIADSSIMAVEKYRR